MVNHVAMKLTFILFAIVLNVSNGSIGKEIILKDAADKYGAVCLDGTPGVYYFAQGE